MGTGTLAPTLKHALLAYATWTILYIFGLLRDFVRNRRGKASFKGYAPIRQDFEDFFTRRIYYRIHDVFNCPVKGPPSAWMDIIERTPVNRQKPLMATGKIKRCLNLGSYNYLGFASSDPYCTPRVLDTLSQHGWSLCSSRADAGTTPVHEELERELASFLGKQAVLTCGMGFATNSVFLPVLAGPGTLVFSDALNHVSIVTGVRAAKGTVRVFDHNDPVHLEQLLRQAMLEGQPRTHRPWKKVIIVVEGIYSMEGEVVDLAGFVAVAKKYKAYIWLDEAHSIGAMGATGRGVCEHLGVSPADIDVLMGTFSKSFGACGGYVAANKDVIDYFMAQCPAHLHATAMTPPAVQMVLSALRLITGADGSDRGAHKLSQLRTNANYFRSRLLHMGFNVLGDWDSPVMPIMIFQLAKLSATSHEMLRLGVAVVVVGFPATPLLTSRMRVCISASHTRQDLDYALQLFDYVATKCDIRDPPLAASNLVFLGPADSPPAGQPLGPPNEWVPLAPSDHPSSPPPAWAPLPLVPWDLATTATVLALWLLGFWCLAYGALPCALALAGLDPGSPAPVFQALRHLALDVAQLALTLGLLGRALREHAPRARGLFALRALPLSDWVGPALAGAATFPAIHAVHRLAVALTVPGVPAPGGGGGDAAARALLGSGDGATRALWFFMLAACAPVWEEAMFRGFLLPSLATHMPRWAAVLASAAVFACVHFSRENFLPLLLLGCVFGAAYSHRANLLPCILLHSLWNVFLLVSVCGF